MFYWYYSIFRANSSLFSLNIRALTSKFFDFAVSWQKDSLSCLSSSVKRFFSYESEVIYLFELFKSIYLFYNYISTFSRRFFSFNCSVFNFSIEN